jgi:hypothetical protein
VKKGDRIVCVDISDASKLKLNSIYTIENYLDKNDGCIPQILLQEIEDIYYKSERFVGLRELRKQKLMKIKKL